MAYNFYQNSKMVSQQINANQEQYEQNQEAKINDNINQYRNEQFNYKVALNQEEQVSDEIEDQNKISGVSDLITSGFELPAGVNSIKNAYQKVKQVYNNLGKTAENAKSVASDLSDTIQSNVSNVSDVVSKASDAVDNTANALSNASSKIQNAVSSAGETIQSAVSDAGKTIQSSVSGASETIQSAVSGAPPSTGEKVFDNPLYGEDLGVKSAFTDTATTETKAQFGTADYTGAQASSVPQPVLPTEQPAPSASSSTSQGTSGVLENNQEVGSTKTPQQVSYKVQEGSEADLASTDESALGYKPPVKVSEVVPDAPAEEGGGGLLSDIFGGIGDVFEGIGDVLDPVIGLASLGAGIYGAVEGAKHLEDAKPDLPAPPTPPPMVTDFVPQANIASTAQPGV